MAESYWDHIAKAYKQVSIYGGPSALDDELKKFPPYVGDLLAVHWFLSEISNGGILQFFANPTSVLASRTVEAFSNLGLPIVADVMKQSIIKASILPDSMPRTLFSEEEHLIYQIGGNDLGRIYDRMDAYAKENRANQ